MAGGFNPIDEEQCVHYAAFASHLDRKSFDAIYWILFGVNILILFTASWQYSQSVLPIRVSTLAANTTE